MSNKKTTKIVEQIKYNGTFSKYESFSSSNKLILLLPLKTGTGSLVNSLKAGGVKFDELPNSYTYDEKYRAVHLTFKEMLNVYSIPQSTISQYKVIQVVRNPWDLFISTYLFIEDMCLVNYPEYYEHIPFKKWAITVKKYRHFLPDNEEKFWQNITKKGFIRSIRARAKPYYQQSWYNDINYNNIKYFKIEDLVKDITPLEDYLDLEIVNMLHINTVQDRRNIYTGFKYISTKPYKEYYDNETKNIVEELYAEDIKKFNYSYPF